MICVLFIYFFFLFLFYFATCNEVINSELLETEKFQEVYFLRFFLKFRVSGKWAH